MADSRRGKAMRGTKARSASALRTERWRANQRRIGRPEGSDVDDAVAAALAMYATAAATNADLEVETLKSVLQGAVSILVNDRGCDRQHAKVKVRQRMGRFGYVIVPLDADPVSA